MLKLCVLEDASRLGIFYTMSNIFTQSKTDKYPITYL